MLLLGAEAVMSTSAVGIFIKCSPGKLSWILCMLQNAAGDFPVPVIHYQL